MFVFVLFCFVCFLFFFICVFSQILVSVIQSPLISEHQATLSKPGTTLVSPTSPNSTATLYTDEIDFTSIRIKWKTSYQPSGLPDLNAGGHPYVRSAALGLVSSAVTVAVHRELLFSSIYLSTNQCFDVLRQIYLAVVWNFVFFF